MSHRNPWGWSQSRFIVFGDVVDFKLLLGIEFCDCKCNNLKGFGKKEALSYVHMQVSLEFSKWAILNDIYLNDYR